MKKMMGIILATLIATLIMSTVASADPLMIKVGSNPSMYDIRYDANSIEVVDANKVWVSVVTVGLLNNHTVNKYKKQFGLKRKPYAMVTTLVFDFVNLYFTVYDVLLVDKNFNILYSYENGLNNKWERIGKTGYIYATACEVFDRLNDSKEL